MDGDCVDGPPSEDASWLAAGASSTGQMMNHLFPVWRTEQRTRTHANGLYTDTFILQQTFGEHEFKICQLQVDNFFYHFADKQAGGAQVAVLLFPGD